jgi:FMN phosphatase YigB (HAD superfamily)
MKEKLRFNIINTCIFDMDGTLYQFVGSDNGYRGSKLESIVRENALGFIIDQDKCPKDRAQTVLETGLNNQMGLSTFLSERYGVTRGDYFNKVWDIDPSQVIKDFEIPVSVATKLAAEKNLILLTSAPKIWQEKVINYLGLTGVFKNIYTGEDFKDKSEIFELLSRKFVPSETISIGDQKITDILPAEKFGISGVLIRNQDDFIKLAKILNI